MGLEGSRGLGPGQPFFLALPLALTDGSGDSQGPVDSPAVHMRHEAAQRLNALLLILWETARVGAWARWWGRVTSAAT